MIEQFQRDGFLRVPYDPATAAWAKAARAPAAKAAADPAEQVLWLRGQGTWFVGVDVLPNQSDGAIGGVPLRGAALDLIAELGWTTPQWHRAQVSVVYPGYPRAVPGETAAATRFRRDRDGAHVDGLLPEGPMRRRMLREPHAFILGLPLTPVQNGASPLVVWQGSHRVMTAAFAAILAGQDPVDWPNLDLTEAYHNARRQCFDTCTRVELPAQPGEALLLHRHMLHGIAPWGQADLPMGRQIAYFRPEVPHWQDWL